MSWLVEEASSCGDAAVAAMAHTLIRRTEMISGKGIGRGEAKRKDGKKRKHATPRSMQIWRLIRRYLTLPARISYHGREIVVAFLGICDVIREEIRHYWFNICGC
jgi:hypothetical protein